MRENSVKRTLASGGTAIGTMVFEFPSTGIGRIIGAAGADFVIYDMEHTGWSIETIRMLMATTRASEAIPMVRPPANRYDVLSRPLDVGAMGLMVPMVETEEQARSMVRSAKYFPEGGRGAAFGVAHDDYQSGAVTGKMASANAEGMLIAQIETVSGVENAEAIAAVDGIDCLWIGHFDLTQSMGIPAQFDHPEFQRAVDRVLAACAKHGKAAGIMGGDVATCREWLARGFRAIAYSGDLWIYGAALKEGVDALKSVAGANA